MIEVKNGKAILDGVEYSPVDIPYNPDKMECCCYDCDLDGLNCRSVCHRFSPTFDDEYHALILRRDC